MSKLHFTTKHANEATVKRDWYVVDGTNQTVGRMCSKIAAILRGKNKAYYTPHVDCGDFIVVINADKVVFTGNKLEDKIYINFSGYPGGKKRRDRQEPAEASSRCSDRKGRKRHAAKESPRTQNVQEIICVCRCPTSAHCTTT